MVGWCSRYNYMSSQPGEGGIPYTHREIFLAASNAVGQGLDTFGNIGSTDLRSKDTIEALLSDPNSRGPVKQNDQVFTELLKSKYLNVNFESEIAALYLERNAPHIGTQNGYEDIAHLINDETLENWSEEDIQWLLGVQVAHSTLANQNGNYMERLMRQNSNWIKYWQALSTYGNGSWDSETFVQIAKQAINNFNRNTNTVFQNNNMRTQLLEQSNGLHDTSNSGSIPTDHDIAISNQTISPNIPKSSNYGSIRGLNKNSPYTSEAVGALEQSIDLRNHVAAGKVGVHVDDFSFAKLINDEYNISFFDALQNHLHDELIASQHVGKNDFKTDNEAPNATASMNLNGKIGLYGDNDRDQVAWTGERSVYGNTVAYASLTFRPINVEGYDLISFEGSQSTSSEEYLELQNKLMVNGTNITGTELGGVNIAGLRTIEIELQTHVHKGTSHVEDRPSSGDIEITQINLT